VRRLADHLQRAQHRSSGWLLLLLQVVCDGCLENATGELNWGKSIGGSQKNTKSVKDFETGGRALFGGCFESILLFLVKFVGFAPGVIGFTVL